MIIRDASIGAALHVADSTNTLSHDPLPVDDSSHDSARFIIRLYHQGDEPALREICVRTGKSGQDASDWMPGGLLPDIYLSPYVRYAPDLVFVVERNGTPCGYAIAAADTAGFVAWYRERWLPVFLERHQVIDPPVSAADRLTRTGCRPENFLGPDQDRYPAHMHIDLLPVAQGQGIGRRLMHTMLAELHRRGIPGVQLGVGASNMRARGFYAHLGFRPLPSTPDNPLQLCINTGCVDTGCVDTTSVDTDITGTLLACTDRRR